MSWLISAKTDPDFATYVAAVEAADGNTLEVGVRQAYYDFIVGCKADGIWDAIKASCILAGARTLDGCLVPLAGTAPTNVNFVAGDYDRKTGLIGDGSTKYLNSNRNNNVDPQNNKHLAAYVSNTSAATNNINPLITASAASASSGYSQFGRVGKTTVSVGINSSEAANFSSGTLSPGFAGVSRDSSTSINYRLNTASGLQSGLVANDSATPIDQDLLVLGRFTTTTAYSQYEISFYSIGEALDLALLDARVTALIAAIAAAIP